jgi:WD40 repeat protein
VVIPGEKSSSLHYSWVIIVFHYVFCRPLTEISFVEDGEDKTLLVSSAHDKTPQIRNGETGDWIGSFHGHKGAVWSVKVDSLTRTLAVTASGDFSSKLWCVTTGKELFEFKHKHVVKSADFTSVSPTFSVCFTETYLFVFVSVFSSINRILSKLQLVAKMD